MKYYDKSTQIGGYMWIWIANKYAKFHAKTLNQNENIPKVLGGLLFLKHPVDISGNWAELCPVRVCRPTMELQLVLKEKLKHPQWLRQLRGRCITIIIPHNTYIWHRRDNRKRTKLKFVTTFKGTLRRRLTCIFFSFNKKFNI